MRTLVTGHRGFIGSHLKLQNMVGFDIKDGPEYDITYPYSVEMFLKENKPDVVVHLAANPRAELSQKYPWWDVQVNLRGLLNVLHESLKNKVKLFVFASTCLIYDNGVEKPTSEAARCNPRSIYSIGKYTGELYCKNFQERGLNTCVLRFFNVYGPGQLKGYVVPDLIEKASLSDKVLNVLGPYGDSRDFIYVGDVAEAIKKVIEKAEEVSGHIINIGTGVETYIGHLCELIAKCLGKDLEFNFGERPLGRFPGTYQADIIKARLFLSWEPKVTLEEGIKLTLKGIEKG